MKVLIIGGNGYIGSKIIREFVTNGHSVVCTKRQNSNLSRVVDLKDRIKWIPASIDGVETAMQYMDFDYVLNMACNYDRNIVKYKDVVNANLEFPLQVLNSAFQHGTKNFLTIDTGLPNRFDMYSFSKKIFGEFGKYYVEKHEINFQSLLLEMFYGPDEPQDRFLPSIIMKMINGEPVRTTIGSQHRDLISSDDVVAAVMMVVASDLRGFCEIPIGTGVSPSVSEVVDYIWEQTGRRSKVYKGVISLRADEPDCVADISVLQTLGSWHPVEWRDGLLMMIKKMSSLKTTKIPISKRPMKDMGGGKNTHI